MSNRFCIEAKLRDLKNNLDTAQLSLNNAYKDLAKLQQYIEAYFNEEVEETNEEVEEANELEEIIKEITDRLNNTYGSKISIVVKEVK